MNEFENKDLAPPPELLEEPQFRSELMRRAAEAGPGYRGRRNELSREQAVALASEIRASGEEVPAFLGASSKWIDRRAKLFEAGEYPDKGVSISDADLRRLAEGFDMPVPVLIEHAESPLELGFLTQVEASGHELFGNLALTEEANALVEKSDARALSLGLSRDLSEIREVSLVRKPRVETAKMFGAEVCFWSELQSELSDSSDLSDWKARFNELSAKVEKGNASRRVDELIKEGKLLPAQAEYATAILHSEQSIDFDGVSRPLHQLLIAMIEKQPPHGLFSEIVPGGSPSLSAQFSPEEADFYRKHFPDVSLDAIAARKSQV